MVTSIVVLDDSVDEVSIVALVEVSGVVLGPSVVEGPSVVVSRVDVGLVVSLVAPDTVVTGEAGVVVWRMTAVDVLEHCSFEKRIFQSELFRPQWNGNSR